MSIVLLSPNPGAEDAASDLLPFLAKNRNNGSRLNNISIQEIKNGKETVEKKADRLLLAPVSFLFMVEQLCMPSSLENGMQVIVYKTTIRINSRTYVAVHYTNTTGETVTRFASLLPGHFELIMQRLGCHTVAGTWQRLLVDEKLERFRFF